MDNLHTIKYKVSIKSISFQEEPQFIKYYWEADYINIKSEYRIRINNNQYFKTPEEAKQGFIKFAKDNKIKKYNI